VGVPAIALLSQKGGSGKTTLAIHLAVAAGDALLLDCDRQKSATGWWQSREAASPEVVAAPATQVRRAIDLGRRKWTIIDTPPQVDADARLVAQVADFVLIPTRPGILDLRAISATIDIVTAAGKPAAIVLNAGPPGRGVSESGILTDARRALRAYPVPVAPVSIGHRVALAHSIADGRAAGEYEPDGRAAQEITRLWEWLRAKTST
jgi:chromosome partitioning protein